MSPCILHGHEYHRKHQLRTSESIPSSWSIHVTTKRNQANSGLKSWLRLRPGWRSRMLYVNSTDPGWSWTYEDKVPLRSTMRERSPEVRGDQLNKEALLQKATTGGDCGEADVSSDFKKTIRFFSFFFLHHFIPVNTDEGSTGTHWCGAPRKHMLRIRQSLDASYTSRYEI